MVGLRRRHTTERVFHQRTSSRAALAAETAANDLVPAAEAKREEPGSVPTSETCAAAESARAAGDGSVTGHIEETTSGNVSGAPPLQSRCEWLSRALTALAPRYQAAAGECSLLTCLNQ